MLRFQQQCARLAGGGKLFGLYALFQVLRLGAFSSLAFLFGFESEGVVPQLSAAVVHSFDALSFCFGGSELLRLDALSFQAFASARTSGLAFLFGF